MGRGWKRAGHPHAPRQSLTRQNHGVNELVNGWHADHIYRHDPNAIECFLLMTFLACNIFQAFFALNLKPRIRKGRTRAFWSSLMAAEIMGGINPSNSP